METMNQYQHVRFRPGMYGLHGNYFSTLLNLTILDLLHDCSFTTLKITTDAKRNQVTMEASERRDATDVAHCWSFLVICGISSYEKFSAEYEDGSCRRTVIKEAVPQEESFSWESNPGLKKLECKFILHGDEVSVDEKYVRSAACRYSKIFPNCRIICNGYEYKGCHTKNKITYFLQPRHKFVPADVPIYEFNDISHDLIWEVSFYLKAIKKKRISYINGIKTLRGGTHVDCITKAIKQAFQKIEPSQKISLENLNFAISVHLSTNTPEIAICFDNCRFNPDLRLESNHREFKLLAKELKSQIIKYFSDHNK